MGRGTARVDESADRGYGASRPVLGTALPDAVPKQSEVHARGSHRAGVNNGGRSALPGLLAGILHASRRPLRTIHHKVGFDWYTPPRSRFASIRRLMPSQILDLSSGAVTPRRLLPPVPAIQSYDAVLARLQECLTTAMQNAAQLTETVWLPLTGGYDSRLLLATAVHAGIPVRAFTYGTRGMATGDRVLPPQLAQAAGVPHAFDWGTGFTASLTRVYEQHVAGLCVDSDRYLITLGYFGSVRPTDIVLAGGWFELGRGFYWKLYPATSVNPNPPETSAIVQPVYKVGLRREREITGALQAWVSWARQTPHEEMDWRDRFYLEQRLGGWRSSVAQALDLANGTEFFAANPHLYYGCVLQVPADKRVASQHHVDLIARMAPELKAFPFNPPDRARLGTLKTIWTRRECHSASALAWANINERGT